MRPSSPEGCHEYKREESWLCQVIAKDERERMTSQINNLALSALVLDHGRVKDFDDVGMSKASIRLDLSHRLLDALLSRCHQDLLEGI